MKKLLTILLSLFITSASANVVLNRTTYAVKDVVNQTLQELEIQGVTVIVTFLEKKGLKGWMLPAGNRVYYIGITRGHGSTSVEKILKHELIHLDQYELGVLEEDGPESVIYMGKRYSRFDIQAPHEMDAYCSIKKWKKLKESWQRKRL